MENITVDYKTIFRDILEKKYPDKKDICKTLLTKKQLSAVDIVELNKKIFEESSQTHEHNHKYRAYTKSDILKILDYQKTHHLNNSQLANHFKLSRNSVTKWKKMFLI